MAATGQSSIDGGGQVVSLILLGHKGRHQFPVRAENIRFKRGCIAISVLSEIEPPVIRTFLMGGARDNHLLVTINGAVVHFP